MDETSGRFYKVDTQAGAIWKRQTIYGATSSSVTVQLDVTNANRTQFSLTMDVTGTDGFTVTCSDDDLRHRPALTAARLLVSLPCSSLPKEASKVTVKSES